jgi:transcriptional regulator with XRE-family HTH domain
LSDQHHPAITLAMDVRERLGTNLRRLRKAKGLSQEKFALEHGLDRTYVSGIERGVRNPTIVVVQRLADALRVEVAELFAK